MKVWKIKNEKDIKLDEFTCPREKEQIKVKISKAAISSTDICALAKDGQHILTPCHSAMGFVSESDNELYKFGSRVIVSPFVETLVRGKKVVEVMGVNREGLLQDFINLPESNVFVLPEGIPISDEEAVFAEYIATGIKVLEPYKGEKGKYVVIAGASTLGLIVAQLCVYYQLVPILIDMDADKLALSERCGIYYTLNPTFSNLEKSIDEITGGRKCDVAVLAGEGVALKTVPYLLKDEGEIVISGYILRVQNQIATDVILAKQLKIIGVNNGFGEMPTAINILANKIVKTEGFIDHRIAFSDLPSIVEDCIQYPYHYNKILVEF